MNGAGRKPTTLLTNTIRPSRWARMVGSTARVARTAPKKFTSKRSRAWAVSVSSIAPTMLLPALLTRTSIRPAFARISATPRSTDASSRTSSTTCSTPGRSAPPAERTVPNTRKPRCANSAAVALPIPDETPVTTATLDLVMAGLPCLEYDYNLNGAGPEVNPAAAASHRPALCLERLLQGRIRDVACVVRHHGNGQTGDDLQHLVGAESGAPEGFDVGLLQVPPFLDQAAGQRPQCAQPDV